MHGIFASNSVKDWNDSYTGIGSKDVAVALIVSQDNGTLRLVAISFDGKIARFDVVDSSNEARYLGANYNGKRFILGKNISLSPD